MNNLLNYQLTFNSAKILSSSMFSEASHGQVIWYGLSIVLI